MKRKGIIYGACLAAALIICIIWIFIQKNRIVTQPVAYIYQDGQLIRTIELYNVESEYSFDIECTDGGSNTVCVKPGSIGITYADCPDKVCVKTGFISSDAVPVVCLPHRLMIQIRGAGDEGPDSITY